MKICNTNLDNVVSAQRTSVTSSFGDFQPILSTNYSFKKKIFRIKADLIDTHINAMIVESVSAWIESLTVEVIHSLETNAAVSLITVSTGTN